MQTLPTPLRNKLERVIVDARDAAEAGARAALEALAVHHYEPYGHQSFKQRKLRNHLRARARQLGDKQDRNGNLDITHLVGECAYEHWHRMLFARFLAENNLLIEPQHGIAISLEECEELAQEEVVDLWTLASRFAQKMLPQIFRPDDPLLQVSFAMEHRVKLEKLLGGLESETFTASDSLGWVYQFWQSRRKKEVNESGKKIGADELPAVTQLFTEPYMVHFLIHNTLGAWYAGKVLKAKGELAATAKSEQELRDAIALPGLTWDYLRFVKVEAASSRFLQCKHEECVSSRFAHGNQSEPSHLKYFDRTDDIENLSGNLPHWRQEGVAYFVTFRTADSMPQDKLKLWAKEKEEWLRSHPEPHDEATLKDFYERFPKRLQYWLDQGYGACLLSKPALRKLVESAIRHFDGERYSLDEFTVSVNHVHAIVTPLPGHTLSEILHSWKSFTANEINKAEGRSGTFWQKESFDHIIRSPAQLEKVREYIRAHEEIKSKRLPAASFPPNPLPAASFNPDPIETPEGIPQESECQDFGDGAGTENKRQDAACTMMEWRPAAGTFEGWPETAAQLKALDPCCGSGHFIVALLRHFVPIRMHDEQLSVRDALDAVIRDNLHGLEIDERCTQIAAFAVALAAWTYPGAEGFRPLPGIRIACCGIAPNAKKEEWLEVARLAADSMAQVNDQGLFPDPGNETMWHVQLKNGMDALYELFKQAPVLGSLIDPRNVKGDLFKADFEQLADLMHDALGKEQTGVGDEMHEMAVAAKGVADAVKLLAGRYHLVITNVPYLARGKQGDVLREYIETYHGMAKQDLATAFVERTLGLCNKGGSSALVTPQNWLFLGSYKKLREKLLRDDEWNSVARLGARAFETISGEVVNVALIGISHSLPSPEHQFAGVDVSDARDAETKAVALRGGEEVAGVGQKRQLENPDARIAFEESNDGILLADIADYGKGSTTGDSPHYHRAFWEYDLLPESVVFWLDSPDHSSLWTGRNLILYTALDDERLRSESGCWLRGQDLWGKPGVVVNKMSNLQAFLYNGEVFDDNIAPICPHDINDIPAIAAYCLSPMYATDLRKVDQALKVTAGTITKVRFNKDEWRQQAETLFPNGLPSPYTDDPTQWLFHGHSCGSVVFSDQSKRLQIGSDRRDSTVLHVALARLLNYRWPAELDPDMRLSKESRELVAKCEELLPLADKDGIVCIPSVRGEEIAADRLRAMLAKAYGDSWSPQVEHDILTATGGNATDLDDWLRNEFFEQHCKLFHHRPFIWHIWDGRKRDGFHALVNYHQLVAPDGGGRKLLESLTYSYLGDWINRQKDGVRTGEGGAEDRLLAAEQLQARLKAILEGEAPYDIFVRWKPIHKQAIGWEPDINDGVRMNIRPFMAGDIPGGKKGAGVLRWKPNIKWDKDRGTEPRRKKDEYPWFWDGSEFTGERVNDRHYPLAEKRYARELVGLSDNLQNCSKDIAE